MKLAREIAEALCALMAPEANTTIATRNRMPKMAIHADSMAIIIAAKLEPVRDALNSNVRTLETRGDMPLQLALNKQALALLSEEEDSSA